MSITELNKLTVSINAMRMSCDTKLLAGDCGYDECFVHDGCLGDLVLRTNDLGVPPLGRSGTQKPE